MIQISNEAHFIPDISNDMMKISGISTPIWIKASSLLVSSEPYLFSLGKFNWGVRYVIIFLCVQFWLRLAAVSYRGDKVRTVASPMVRSVKKSCDTRNCGQDENMSCVIFIIRVYYEALGSTLCDLIWQIRHNYNRLEYGNCDVTGHPKMSVLGPVGSIVKTYETIR